MVTMAKGILFVDERVTSALVVGIVAGATGWFLLTYDHGRRQESIDDTRMELTRLTDLLKHQIIRTDTPKSGGLAGHHRRARPNPTPARRPNDVES